MRVVDVVAELKRRLPSMTEELTDTIAVVSVVQTGFVATVTTSTPSGLVAGSDFSIVGAVTPVGIASITHAANARTATATTSADHDLTLYRFDLGLNVVSISGAQPDFNGTRKLVAVPNRRTFVFEVGSDAPASGAGTMILLNGASPLRTVRGSYRVDSVVDATHFTFVHATATNLGTLSGAMSIRTKPRVTAAVTEEAAVRSYSERFDPASPSARQAVPWLYVVLGDAAVSRRPSSPGSLVSFNTITQDWSESLVQQFSVHLAIPASTEAMGARARDRAEAMLGPILRSLVGRGFPTDLARSEPVSPVQFVGHGASGYAGPTYWHAFQFEQTANLSVDDTIEASAHVAFRDVSLQIAIADGATPLESEIDLDEIPL